MSKKIIILNGSPRTNGNTKSLIDAFICGAKDKGHQISCFNLQQMNIHGCLGCFGGGKDKNSPCVQKDDMIEIYPKYVEADIVVLASPMYYWGISGQLKCAFDRLFAVAECDKNCENPKKDCILLMAAEGDGEQNARPVTDYYNSLLKFLNWKNLGCIIAGGVLKPGEIKGHPALETAKNLGSSL
ncbi:putative uncharacterized protein [Acetobacter sp. CAG:977]|mgnify:FL=1|nr:putative uncharacterized protein [Acetobacter sp. CAG:977]